MMRLVIQIFRKDVERLWPAILLTLALLTYWTFRDATLGWTGSPSLFSFNDDWLNLALPFAWAVLIALAVHQDSLVGDRQFWTALPCDWRPLLTAKVAFTAIFIHLFYFIATAIVLTSRGFDPAAHMPHLFWKQIVLLALTIPAFGAATLVKNTAHFLLLIVVAASGAILRPRQFNIPQWQVWQWDIRWNIALTVLVAGAVAVVSLQFIRRCTRRSRVLGILSAVMAAGLYVWIPRDATAALSAVFSPSSESRNGTGVRVLAIGPGDVYSLASNFQMTTVALPLMIEGTSGDESQIDPVSLEIITGDGAHFDVTPAKYTNPSSKDQIAATVIGMGTRGQCRLDLHFYSASAWECVRRGSVTLRGRMVANYARPGVSAVVSNGGATEVGESVRCHKAEFSRPSGPGNQIVSMECDSPEIEGRNIAVGQESGRWSGVPLMEVPGGWPYRFSVDRWLSPVHRSMASWGGALRGDLKVTPLVPGGYGITDYTLSNVDLKQFVVPANPSPRTSR